MNLNPHTCATSTDYLSIKRLLERAELLYERHNIDNRESFNVFSVLRSVSDEVNLHSRFLAALLAHQKPGKDTQQNLEDFVSLFVSENLNFKFNGARIERERDNIDILISNWKCRQAVVIENKIWADDQSDQLNRYAGQLKNAGYQQIDVLYLTLDGQEPTEDSKGDHEVRCLSYIEIIPWLENCQERAYDEPGLREAVGQYIDLVQKLTGTDVSEDYMKELQDLILKDKKNITLIYHLNEAMIAARVELLGYLWKEIDEKTGEFAKELPNGKVPSKGELEKFCGNSRKIYPGIRYQFKSGASLVVETETYIYFGLICSKKDHPAEYDKLHDALTKNPNSNGGWFHDDKSPGWQWEPKGINWKNPTIEDMELLSNNQARKEYAAEIAKDVAGMWEQIKDIVLQSGAKG